MRTRFDANPHRFCCKYDTPPSGTRRRRSDKTFAARWTRRQSARIVRAALRED
jgi:hypothetical protein